MPRVLSRPEDAHCVVYHGFVVAAYVTAFWLWLHPEYSGLTGFWPCAAFVVAISPMLGWISGVNLGVNYHNHTHRPIFAHRWLNRWFERIWTPFCAWPAKYWRHLHVAVHHKYLLGSKDWSTRRRRASGAYESCLSFQLCHWPWRHNWHIAKDIVAGRFHRRTALTELFWFALLWPIPFWIDPLMGVCCWLVPQWCGNVITMGRGMFVQHAGCEPWIEGEAPNHSNDFLLPFYNLTMFEIGYHALHHDYPGVHWSDLPDFAERRGMMASSAEGQHGRTTDRGGVRLDGSARGGGGRARAGSRDRDLGRPA
ncbi:MAG: fatty acid desaturase [Planctomycetes bacterium]|nr:fatty acid desaturase [Planctomycetota bacterium]